MNRLLRTIGLPFLLGVLFCGTASSQQPPDKAQPSPVTGLVPDHATLSVQNLEREAAWYERVLGFKVLSRSISNGQDPNWHLVIPGYRIDLVQRKGAQRVALDKSLISGDSFNDVFLQLGWIHVSFHVTDVSAAFKALQALKVDVRVKKDDQGNPIQLRIEDPEGNEVEIRRNVVL